ncbi:hypothetical protein KF840_10260 [bacterium]|nr:hypothetical protein [bacterium]
MDVSFADLWRHYRACRRSKRNTLNALAFEIDAESKLLELQRELRQHSSGRGRYVELLGPQRLLAQRALDLRPARIPRFGYALTAGFSLARETRMVERALAGGWTVLRLGSGRAPVVIGGR